MRNITKRIRILYWFLILSSLLISGCEKDDSSLDLLDVKVQSIENPNSHTYPAPRVVEFFYQDGKICGTNYDDFAMESGKISGISSCSTFHNITRADTIYADSIFIERQFRYEYHRTYYS